MSLMMLWIAALSFSVILFVLIGFLFRLRSDRARIYLDISISIILVLISISLFTMQAVNIVYGPISVLTAIVATVLFLLGVMIFYITLSEIKMNRQMKKYKEKILKDRGLPSKKDISKSIEDIENWVNMH